MPLWALSVYLRAYLSLTVVRSINSVYLGLSARDIVGTLDSGAAHLAYLRCCLHRVEKANVRVVAKHVIECVLAIDKL